MISAIAQDEAHQMTKKILIQMGKDGLPDDDIAHRAATAEDLHSYEQAAEDLYRSFKVPTLLDLSDKHSYLLVGLFDHVGNNARQGPLFATNIAKFRDQIGRLSEAGVGRVHVEYSADAGARTNILAKLHEEKTGRTGLRRVEEIYERLTEQAQSIFDADPLAKLRIHLEGFGLGASLVPLLARMIDTRGLQHSKNEAVTPGMIPISVGLYDPMPASYMKALDCRLPPSIVSGLQISAAQRRGNFPSDWTIPHGLSSDGRFFNMTVAGASKDIGGGYLRDGLAIRSLNLMTDYHNALFSEPLIHRMHEPLDSRMNVIHRV